MTVPYKLPEIKVKRSEIDKWLKERKLSRTKVTVTRATNALRAEKRRDALPLGRDVSFVGADNPRLVVYGRARIGGTVVFMDVRASNRYIDMVVTWTTHDIEALDEMYLDEALVVFGDSPDPRWAIWFTLPDGSTVSQAYRKAFVGPFGGTDNQVAQADLVANNPSKWTSEHRLRGVSGAYILLVWDSFVYGDGIPEMSFVIRGKKVYDPRSETTYYTDNAALCAADYLMNTRYGVGVPASKIDMDSLADAADICDETVSINGGAATEKRYTVNGAFTTDESHGRVLERMAAAMGGQITFSNGLWKFWPAVWRTPALEITDNDLRSSVNMQTLASRDDIFNAVRGTHVSRARGYIETDYPSVINTNYANTDGETIYENIDFHFVTSSATCQRLAKLELERMRQGIQVEIIVSLKAFSAQTPENVYLTLERQGWVNKPFEVVKADFIMNRGGDSPEILVALSLRETASGVFDWNYGEQTVGDLAPNTNLPSPFSISLPSNVALASGTAELYIRGDGTVAPRIKVTWDEFADFFVTSGGQIEIQKKPSIDSNWVHEALVNGASTIYYIPDVKDGIYYDVRVRSINAFGGQSDWVTILNHFVVGKTAPPSDVTGFTVLQTEYGLQLNWTSVEDIDLSYYEIREGASWDAGTLVTQIDSTRLVLDLRAASTYNFFIKSVDTSENYSVNATSAVSVVSAHTIPSASYSIVGPNLVLDWDEAIGGSWAISDYLVTFGNTFNTSTLVASTKASAYTLTVDWLGARRFWIQPRDVFGNLGTPFNVDVTVAAPNMPSNLRPEVIDNNVLLRWSTPSPSTLPVVKYVVRKGDTYAYAETIGDDFATFAAIFELLSGTFTYWVEAVDSAGNSGPAANTSAIVNEPPDFELISDQVLSGGQEINVVESPAGTVVGPFDNTQTWEEHFLNNSWDSPQDQIDAGYLYFLQPEATYGRWEKTIDLGTTLNNILLHLSYTRTDILGSQTVTPKIAYSTDNVNWTEVADVFSLLATSVRYARVRIDLGTVPEDDIDGDIAQSISAASQSVVSEIPFGGPIVQSIGAPFTDVTAALANKAAVAQTISAPDNAIEAEAEAGGNVTGTVGQTLGAPFTDASAEWAMRINAGGSSYTDSNGKFWAADNYYLNGSTFSVGGAISGTVDDTLFQTERYRDTGPLNYEFPIPETGDYEIKIYFAEIYNGITGAGQRVFDVQIEGNVVENDLDLYGTVGPLTAVIKTYNVTLANTTIDIDFVSVVESPKVSAIQIKKVP